MASPVPLTTTSPIFLANFSIDLLRSSTDPPLSTAPNLKACSFSAAIPVRSAVLPIASRASKDFFPKAIKAAAAPATARASPPITLPTLLAAPPILLRPAVALLNCLLNLSLACINTL